MKRVLIFALFALIGQYVQAQKPGEFNIGIKAGLNFATIVGPSERSSTDQRLESSAFNTRFLIGPTFRYAFTDKNGLIAEVQYSQKGGRYQYTGDSYHILEGLSVGDLYFEGSRSVTINVSNGYLDIPVAFYHNATSNISFNFGGYVGFLLNSTGAGSYTFDAEARDVGVASDINLRAFTIELDHNYNTDELGEVITDYNSIRYDSDLADNAVFSNAQVPDITTAYYDYTAKDGSFYNGVDAGILAGVEYRFDTGLAVGLRGSLGLIDATNNFYDYSKVSTADPENLDFTRIAREDVDRNFVLQLYVGFEL